jgi:hypothetical protein
MSLSTCAVCSGFLRPGLPSPHCGASAASEVAVSDDGATTAVPIYGAPPTRDVVVPPKPRWWRSLWPW